MTSLTRSTDPPPRSAFPSTIDDLASALMRSGLVAFALVDAGNIIASSPALRQMIGRTTPQLHIDGHALSGIVADGDRSGVADFCAALLLQDTRAEHRCRLLHADGSAIPVALAGSSIHVQGARQVVLVATDLRPWIEPATAESTVPPFLGFDRTTGFATFPLLVDRMRVALAAARRYRRRAAVVRIDLDRLDTLLDALVPEAAEEVQATIAETLRNCVRDCDTLARVGVREFVLLLSEIGARDDAGVTAARVVAAVARLFESSAPGRRVTATIGVAVYPLDGVSPERLLACAETALRTAGGTAGGRFAFADATQAELVLIAPIQLLEEHQAGVPDIDNEHREIVGRVNLAIEDLQCGADPGRLGQDVREIAELLRDHFETEARYLGSSASEGLVDLRTRNLRFLDELECILLHVNRQSVALAIRHLHDWLVPHLLDLDYAMAS